jgi:hypothetical protein
MVKVNFDGASIKAAAKRAFRDTVLVLEIELVKAITEPVYPWPRGDSPRDIVDTGKLRASQRFTVSGMTANWVWPVEYALIVHDGAKLNNGTILPPRPWTERALKARPPDQVFEQLLKRYV